MRSKRRTVERREVQARTVQQICLYFTPFSFRNFFMLIRLININRSRIIAQNDKVFSCLPLKQTLRLSIQVTRHTWCTSGVFKTIQTWTREVFNADSRNLEYCDKGARKTWRTPGVFKAYTWRLFQCKRHTPIRIRANSGPEYFSFFRSEINWPRVSSPMFIYKYTCLDLKNQMINWMRHPKITITLLSGHEAYL